REGPGRPRRPARRAARPPPSRGAARSRAASVAAGWALAVRPRGAVPSQLMNDPSGVQSALGIEAVEWFAQGGENLTVRVTGRWRRRRPAWSGQPMLVVEAQGRSHRFPAMPEPPSISGAVPGTWRISFSVPAAMAPDLGARTWLQLGAVVAPLPPAVEPVPSATTEAMPATPEDADQPPESSPEAEIIIARRLRSSELALESARLREGEARASAAQLAQQIRELEQRLEGERSESTRLAAALSGHERARRSAEQRAHAETELRIELEDRLGARERDRQLARRALGDLAAAEERLRELERELEGLRRRADEAEQAAAAAQAARVRAQRQAGDAARSGTSAAPGPPGPDHAGVTRSRLLERERELVALRARQPQRVPSEPAPAADESAVAVGSVAAVEPAAADESAVAVGSVAAVGPAAADESAVAVGSVAAVGPAAADEWAVAREWG